jgi:copper chaperone
MISAVADTLTYVVPELSCAHCERAVDAELAVVSGVEAVRIDLATKLVAVHGNRLDDAEVRAAIARAGYEVAAA